MHPYRSTASHIKDFFTDLHQKIPWTQTHIFIGSKELKAIIVLLLEHTVHWSVNLRGSGNQESRHNLKEAGRGGWCHRGVKTQLRLTICKAMIMSRAAVRPRSAPCARRLLDHLALHHLQGLLKVKQRTRLTSSEILEQNQAPGSGWTFTVHVDIQTTPWPASVPGGSK